jgi:protein-S-isoprenylcysteine O-methyltransferase Ste14
VTSGPYSVVRHPSYVGAVLALIGIMLSHLGPGSWARECVAFGGMSRTLSWIWIWIFGGFVSVAAITRAKKEDELLRTEFGKEWEEYREKVPWKFIPGVY